MFEKRLITALLNQVTILAIAVEALKSNAEDNTNCYDRGCEIEDLLKQAVSNILRTWENLSELEQMMTINQEPSA